MDLKTPGVYVEEISTLPPSVAAVSTAIPAFIGYTEKGPAIARVTTFLEYKTLFGGPKLARFLVTVDAGGTITDVSRDATTDAEFLMYYAVNHYFKNGGGACWIVSTGHYPGKSDVDSDHFEAALTLLEQEDEPTLLVLTDAVGLPEYYSLCDLSLAQCKKLGDRFAIIDVVPSKDEDGKALDPITSFRNASMNNLMFGAAYYPYLKTTLSYEYKEADVTIRPPWKKTIADDTIAVSYSGSSTAPTVKIVVDMNAAVAATFTVSADLLTITVDDATKGSGVATAWAAWKQVSTNKPEGFDVAMAGDGTATFSAKEVALSGDYTLSSIASTKTALYNQIKAALADQRVVLPPSAAVAGIYASVDRDRGVWKAPANVAVSSIIGPVTKITNDDQDNLNIDPTGAGKSINAIRAFTGKGTLVWGARTLAGNDNEWKFIPVRRLFSMIEESAKKSTHFAVFEPNDMTTWLKVKGMIESFLYGLWERGALAGPTPGAAYFVNVGLGKTMTTDDILNGLMKVEIGIAAVRPAEYILLSFSHKLQQA